MRKSRGLTRRAFVGYAGATLAAGWLPGCAAVTRRDGSAAGAPDGTTAPWEELAELALQRIRRGGAEYGDIRLIHTTGQSIRGSDGRIAQIRDRSDRGFGVRVLVRGAWGFAANSDMSPASVAATADLAVEVARQSARLVNDPVRLAAEPPHVAEVVTARRVDPFATPLAEKTQLLLDAMSALAAGSDVRRTRAALWAQRDEKLFASTEGARIRFDLLATQGELGATAVVNGVFANRTFETPYLRTGYEQIQAADLVGQAARVAEEARAAAVAPAAPAGRYDLVLDPRHLSLTIHESCGHPTELDRALGYEANYAGTSFMTPDQLGKLQYGSPQVSLVADNTEEGCMASTGYDDEGVAGQRWDIVRDGVFVGYSTSREVAPKIGLERSVGSCRADGWESIPIVRIANIGLEPRSGSPDELIAGVERGIYIEGRGSFSIDQRRYNFQFGGDAFWLIERGRKQHMLRDVIYTGITPEFWNACDGVAGPEHRQRWGFITCGKGQPGQSGWMTHAASHARFRGIEVIAGATT